MTGRLVDMAFTLGGKQRVTLELNGDFREIWDKLHLEPILDVEVKKHREKRSHSANAYFHVLVNKIAAETGESDDLVKERLVVAYGTVARDKDGCTVGFKLPVSVDVHDLYKYTRCFDVREEDGKWFNCYLVYKDTSKMDTKEFSHLIDGAIDEANCSGVSRRIPRSSWPGTRRNGHDERPNRHLRLLRNARRLRRQFGGLPRPQLRHDLPLPSLRRLCRRTQGV